MTGDCGIFAQDLGDTAALNDAIIDHRSYIMRKVRDLRVIMGDEQGGDLGRLE